MSEPKIYLAGPVRKLPDGGAQWRDKIVDEFGEYFDFINPLDKYNVPEENLTVVSDPNDPINEYDDAVSVPEIVEGDKEMLRESDGIFVGYFDVQSIGTPMEVMWGYERDYPICLCIMDGTVKDNLSPWYRFHVHSVTDSRAESLIDLEAMTDTEFNNWWVE